MLATRLLGAGSAILAWSCTATAPPPVDSLATGTLDTVKVLQPGELAEGLWSAKPGDHIVISLQAPTPDLDWNLHAHPDGGTDTIVEAFAQLTVDYTFAPPFDAQWFVLVRNHGTVAMNLAVHFETYGGATWAGWQN